jgi:LPXTG-motif cell wall-anchored protein
MPSVVEMPLRTLMRAGAVALLAVVSVLALDQSGAFAQAAAQGCPPGQPSGRPPGAPPGSPPVQTGRPNYPPGRCQLALSQSAGQRGDTFTATGNGFVPGETVALTMAGRSAGSAVADPSGTFVASVTVPGDAPLGSTAVLASGQSQQLSADFQVLGAGAAADPGQQSASLPRTGAQVAGLTGLGALLLAVGALAVTTTRRRRA